MKNKFNKITKKNIILFSIVLILLIVGISLARQIWTSEENNTVFDTTIGDIIGINFKPGNDINVTDLAPVLDYHDGAFVEFEVLNRSNKEYSLATILNIINIDTYLKSPDFKYVLTKFNKTNKEYEEVQMGDFSNAELGDIKIYLDSIPKGYSYYVLYIYIDGTKENDINMMNKNFHATLRLESEELNSVEEMFNDGSEITQASIGTGEKTSTVELNKNQKIMKDNYGNYRYYGDSPNNYVKFNGELWRIISVSNVKVNENTEEEQRMKLIRESEIGNYSYDSSESEVNSGYGINDWSKSDLTKELNEFYYNSKSETCYSGQNNAYKQCDFSQTGLKEEARNMIDNALYYLGGNNTLEGLSASDYYEFERGEKVYDCSVEGKDKECPRATTWSGIIGVMYPSDYLYATDLSLCPETNNNWESNSKCNSNNWLKLDKKQWLISPYSATGYHAYFASETGKIENYLGAAPSNSYIVRPVVYLKSNISIISGNGTTSNPYILKLNNNYLEQLFNDGSKITKVHIGNDNSKPTVEINQNQKIMKDNNGEYRFIGANPNNWVEFNGEKWRIISLSNVKSNKEDRIGTKRIKLIKESEIGNYSYDSSESEVNSGYGINDWSKSDLAKELNEYYYNSNPGTCYNGRYNVYEQCDFSQTGLKEEARNMIDNALYYLGGNNTLEGLFASDYYEFERGEKVYDCSVEGNDKECPRITTWPEKVGIMYPSDYLYATDLSLCPEANNNWESNSKCNSNNWLKLDKKQWLISPYSATGYHAYFASETGKIENYLGAAPSNSYIVRPVVYLKPNVQIIHNKNSTGTSSNPYKLKY